MESKVVSTPVSASNVTTTRPVSILISPGRVTRILIAAVAFLMLAHFAVMYSKFYLGHDVLLGLVAMFDLLRDMNVPTWYSSATLLGCSALLAAIAYARRAARGGFVWHWLGLAIIFLFLSVDETAMIHETVHIQLRSGFDRTQTMYGLAGVVFPALLALCVVITYLTFLASLPRRTRILFVMAGAVFVGGALVVDYLGELYVRSYGDENMGYAVVNGFEEAMEMSGVIIFVYALLGYIRDHVGCVSFTVSGS